jgi:hypothetical protein
VFVCRDTKEWIMLGWVLSDPPCPIDEMLPPQPQPPWWWWWYPKKSIRFRLSVYSSIPAIQTFSHVCSDFFDFSSSTIRQQFNGSSRRTTLWFVVSTQDISLAVCRAGRANVTKNKLRRCHNANTRTRSHSHLSRVRAMDTSHITHHTRRIKEKTLS